MDSGDRTVRELGSVGREDGGRRGVETGAETARRRRKSSVSSSGHLVSRASRRHASERAVTGHRKVSTSCFREIS